MKKYRIISDDLGHQVQQGEEVGEIFAGVPAIQWKTIGTFFTFEEAEIFKNQTKIMDGAPENHWRN